MARPIFRFSLRLLLVLVLALASFFAGWSGHAQWFRQATKSVNQIQHETRQRRDVLLDLRARQESPAYRTLVERREPGPFAYPYALQGVVVARWGETVDLSFGADDGVRKGDHVLVFRNGRIDACLEITIADPDRATGQIVLSRSGKAVVIGDHVIAYVDL